MSNTNYSIFHSLINPGIIFIIFIGIALMIMKIKSENNKKKRRIEFERIFLRVFCESPKEMNVWFHEKDVNINNFIMRKIVIYFSNELLETVINNSMYFNKNMYNVCKLLKKMEYNFFSFHSLKGNKIEKIEIYKNLHNGFYQIGICKLLD